VGRKKQSGKKLVPSKVKGVAMQKVSRFITREEIWGGKTTGDSGQSSPPYSRDLV